MSQSLDQRLLAATIGSLELYSVYLGGALGLYRALADHGPLTADGLAGAAGIHPRYAREWLEQQAVAGFLNAEEPAGSSAGDSAALSVSDSVGGPSGVDAAAVRGYVLPDVHRGALLDPTDPAHLAPFAHMVVGIGGTMPAVAEAFRTGTGVPFGAYGPDLRRGQGAINRPAFTADLTGTWLPALPDLHERLGRQGARIADLCCGVGWSTLAVAGAYPGATVVGLDSDGPSIEEARAAAADAAVSPTFVAADAEALPDFGPFDAVLILEALHDLARPVETLVACREALADGGSVVVADENVAPTFTAPGDDLERMMYGWSVTHCLPASMAEQPSAALGTVLRHDAVHRLAGAAGFAGAEVVDVDAGFFTLYRLRAS